MIFSLLPQVFLQTLDAGGGGVLEQRSASPEHLKALSEHHSAVMSPRTRQSHPDPTVKVASPGVCVLQKR